MPLKKEYNIIVSSVEKKRWKLEMKIFTSYKMRNEDFLYVHNHTNIYCVGENKEFMEQLKIFNDMGLVLYKKKYKKIPI